MAKIERRRELLKSPLSPEHFKQRAEEGWRLVAVEWEREVERGEQEGGELAEDVPFGLRVADDCLHLQEDATEKQVLTLMLELIVQDNPLSKVADELNRRGFRTRQGSEWSPVSVFNMLPRRVEVGPRIFSSEEWAARRRHLFRPVDSFLASRSG